MLQTDSLSLKKNTHWDVVLRVAEVARYKHRETDWLRSGCKGCEVQTLRDGLTETWLQGLQRLRGTNTERRTNWDVVVKEGKCKICGATRRASWQHKWWWRRSQWRASTNRRYKRDRLEISRTSIKDSKCARKNWIPETSSLRKTEKWKLASDYCTIFTLWE